MIDIIIPAYNAHKTIDKTLYSIACQRNIDLVKVYIINDNSDEDYLNEISFFSNFINIEELKIEKNKGPGYARQYGIEHSNGDYILFIDSDDVLSSPLSLNKLYKCFLELDYDVVFGIFAEQNANNDFIYYVNDQIALHAKMYRRKFIEQHHISFPFLYAEEDNAFNQMVFLNNPKIKYVNEKIYLWLNNEKSITRKVSSHYKEDSMLLFSNAMYYVCNYCNRYHLDSKLVASFAYSSLLVLYYSVNLLNFNNDILKCASALKTLYMNNFNSLSDIEKVDIMIYRINCCSNDGHGANIINNSITFNNFIDLLDKEV